MKIVDGSGWHHSTFTSTSPSSTKPSINSLASLRMFGSSGAMRRAVNTGSSKRRYFVCSGPSSPSGIALRLLPRYLLACSTSWLRLTVRMSSIRSNVTVPFGLCRTGHSAARCTYMAWGSALARGDVGLVAEPAHRRLELLGGVVEIGHGYPQRSAGAEVITLYSWPLPDGAEEVPDVGHEQLGHLHGSEVPAVRLLGPVGDVVAVLGP